MSVNWSQNIKSLTYNLCEYFSFSEQTDSILTWVYFCSWHKKCVYNYIFVFSHLQNDTAQDMYHNSIKNNHSKIKTAVSLCSTLLSHLWQQSTD